MNHLMIIQVSRGARAKVSDCQRDWLWVHFFALVAMRGVDFRHLTHDASRIQRFKFPSAYPATCVMEREADLILMTIFIILFS